MLRAAVSLCALAVLVGGVAPPARGQEPVLALLAVQNRAGDAAATAAVEGALRAELAGVGALVDPGRTRGALRRLRIRNGDQEPPAELRRLGEELGADWLLSATVHDVERLPVSRLTVSVRAYRTASGEMFWTGFLGGSGLDDRRLLGLGVLEGIEELAPVVARRLLAELTAPEPRRARAKRETLTGAGDRLGRVILVPFASYTSNRTTAAAETVSEAARTVLFRSGIRLVSPNRVHEVLRRTQQNLWGELSAQARAELTAECDADTIITGSVQSWEVGGSGLEPEPLVSVAMRALAAASGRILWMGDGEEGGWDRGGFFGLRRIYSRGALASRMLTVMTQELLRSTELQGEEGTETS